MVYTTDNYLGTTSDGCNVYDRLDSHLDEKGALTPELLAKAISQVNMGNETFKVSEIHFDYIVGESNCVEINENDLIVMAFLKGREGPFQLVKNRKPSPCQEITIIIRKERNRENHYTLIDAFIGKKSEPRPGDKCLRNNPEALEKSIEFWNTHALIYNTNDVSFEMTEA